MADDASFGSRQLGVTIVHPSWPTRLDFENIEELVCEDRRTIWLQFQCPKNGKVDLLQFQHGNGTAIIRWRWLVDPQAGVRSVATMEWSKGDCWSIWQEASGVLRRGDQHKQEGSVKDGRRRRRVGDDEKNEETDCQRLLSGESQASSGHWLFRL